MEAWNVVVSVREGGYREARTVLEEYGRVRKTDFYNVLVMQVDDIAPFLDALNLRREHSPVSGWLGRLVPVEITFLFQSAEEFEHKALEAVKPWIPQLAGHTFHGRMHRRGFKGRLSSQNEERFLDHVILEQLQQQQQAASVDFDDPDYILAVETVGQRAGLSLWSREQRERYPFLGLD